MRSIEIRIVRAMNGRMLDIAKEPPKTNGVKTLATSR